MKLIRVQLVVECDLLRIGIQHILDSHGISVVCFSSDIDAAFQDLAEQQPDILITSHSLSFGNPYLLARQARKNGVTNTIFINDDIVSENDLQHAIDHGVLSIMSARCTKQQLVEAVRTVAQGRPCFQLWPLGVPCETEIPSQPFTPRRHRLSNREIEVLRCLGAGMRPAQVATELGIAVKTVNRHKANIMTKLGLCSQVQLALYAVREGVSPL